MYLTAMAFHSMVQQLHHWVYKTTHRDVYVACINNNTLTIVPHYVWKGTLSVAASPSVYLSQCLSLTQ